MRKFFGTTSRRWRRTRARLIFCSIALTSLSKVPITGCKEIPRCTVQQTRGWGKSTRKFLTRDRSSGKLRYASDNLSFFATPAPRHEGKNPISGVRRPRAYLGTKRWQAAEPIKVVPVIRVSSSKPFGFTDSNDETASQNSGGFPLESFRRPQRRNSLYRCHRTGTKSSQNRDCLRCGSNWCRLCWPHRRTRSEHLW